MFIIQKWRFIRAQPRILFTQRWNVVGRFVTPKWRFIDAGLVVMRRDSPWLVPQWNAPSVVLSTARVNCVEGNFEAKMRNYFYLDFCGKQTGRGTSSTGSCRTRTECGVLESSSGTLALAA
jgi:hypothetical protein